ncbi:hypothetical protein HDV63DRAFT_414251 [Trichoderma sp. SZMC 28014]
MMARHLRSRLYIAGGPGGNSIGPKVHEYISKSLGLNWTCEFLQLTSVDDVMKLFLAPDFAGGIVTMPHKRTIIPLLDHCDDLVRILGACNFVFLGEDGRLHGTNTDWLGIYDSILAQSPGHIPGRCALVYGAGGASRAAIYALWAKLQCDKIYIINREALEVEELLNDMHQQPGLYWPTIIHVKSITQARQLQPPHYIISTVPDFEPITSQEIETRDILVDFLVRGRGANGLMLDMCYHPPLTSNLRLAIDHGYSIIQGHTVVASQFLPQWKLWTGETIEISKVFQKIERLVKEQELAT